MPFLQQIYSSEFRSNQYDCIDHYDTFSETRRKRKKKEDEEERERKSRKMKEKEGKMSKINIS